MRASRSTATFRLLRLLAIRLSDYIPPDADSPA
jgi:hypothetical protein